MGTSTRKAILLLFLLLVSPVSSSYAQLPVGGYEWTFGGAVSYEWASRRLLTPLTQQHEGVLQVTQCASLCLLSATCKSFNFNANLALCELNDVTVRNASSTVEAGYVYHERQDISIDMVALGPCVSHPCSNGGQCIWYNSASEYTFICVCLPGWTGPDCNISLDASWSSWESWQSCSVTCDRGWQLRRRQCRDGASNDVISESRCGATSVELQRCEYTSCSGWSSWGVWGECSTAHSCGVGSIMRMRQCDLSATYDAADVCPGTNNETQVCYSTNCNSLFRLVGGKVYGEGRVEVFDDKSEYGWIGVCGDGWDLTDASVICRQMGALGASAAPPATPYGVNTIYRFGNFSCEGEETALVRCYHDDVIDDTCSTPANVICTVNGEWSRWAEWGPCSAECGPGSQSRSRVCNSPPPLGGGSECTGDDVMTQSCNLGTCAVDGYWLVWGAWTECSTTCDTGMQTRYRECVDPVGDGQPCPGDEVQNQQCWLQDCSIPGEWMTWGTWGSCSQTCGDGGVRMRTRGCDLTTYGEDTSACLGDATDQKECHRYSCTPLAKTCQEWLERGLEESVYAEINPGSGAFVVRCDLLTFYGDAVTEVAHSCTEPTVVEDFEAPGSYSKALIYGNDGSGEINPDLIQELISISASCRQFISWQCFSASIHHPTDSNLMMTYWKNRLGEDRRYFIGADPSYNGCACGLDMSCDEPDNTCQCDTNDEQLRVDQGYVSYKPDLPISMFLAGDTVNGYYDPWSAWSECSATCAEGERTRTRKCNEPEYSGDPCSDEGEPSETEDCDAGECPVDGVWSNWSEYSECSATCGDGGTQTRTRTCEGQAYGGAPCEGASEETIDCYIVICPEDGYWEDWSTWSDCSATCDTGIQIRTRDCVEPVGAGAACEGEPDDSKQCWIQPCMQPGEWMSWGEWSLCSATCGDSGVRTRSRECDMTKYGDQTSDCEGEASGEKECNRYSCTPTAATCQEWFTRGMEESAFADIQPSGGPFHVYCNQETLPGEVVTEVHHSASEPIEVNGFEAAGAYAKTLVYETDDTGEINPMFITNLIDKSGSCRQFIKWECYSASIHNPNDASLVMTYWMNRENEKRKYFIGDDPSYDGCACGVEMTCANPSMRCECDTNDEVLRTDEGYVSFKDDLPITQILAGDTGGINEYGLYTIGPLECWGDA